MSIKLNDNVYAPDVGEKIYATPIYAARESGKRPISVVGFNNWHAVLGYKYMGKHLYDETYKTNNWPGWEANSGYDAKDWNGNYYISGKSTIDYPLILKESGDLIDANNIYESDPADPDKVVRGDNLACVFTDFYNSPYYDYYNGTHDIIADGITACKNLSGKVLAYGVSGTTSGDSDRKNIQDIINAIAKIDRTLCFNLVQDQTLNL